ncbi:MAG: hypothetical protein JNK53_01900 [Phycisphaerae bacterium]|nr:hypothetical protein [Phycisphaerae bacterium]
MKEEKVVRTSVFASSIAVASGFLVLASTANAAIVTANLPTVNKDNQATGVFSDAYSSNGQYWYGQSVAVQFTASLEYNLSQLTFWGFSENFIQPGLANVAGFQMQILSADLSTVVVNQSWTLGQLAVQATGNIGVTGGYEYQFAGGLNSALSAGTYWLNIGFIAVDGDDDAWVWSTGMNDPSMAAAAFDNGERGWSPWQVQEERLSQSHILFGQIIPGPGALALLAGAGLLTRRRRA